MNFVPLNFGTSTIISSLLSVDTMRAFASLLALTVSGVTPTTYQTIVDLSADLEPSTEYDDNDAFDLSLQRAAKEMPLVRTVLVLERGRIISSYSRKDVDDRDL